MENTTAFRIKLAFTQSLQAATSGEKGDFINPAAAAKARFLHDFRASKMNTGVMSHQGCRSSIFSF